MSDELADKLKEAKMHPAIAEALKKQGVTTLKDLLAKSDSQIDDLPLKTFQKRMLKKFWKDERNKEGQPQQQSQEGRSVKYSVKGSSLHVETAHSGSEATFIKAEGGGARSVTVDTSKIGVKTLGEGSTVSAVHTSGSHKRDKDEETKVTFKRNKMSTNNVGTGSSQIGIKAEGGKKVRVKCTGNNMKMANKRGAARNLQVGVYLSDPGNRGSTSLQSGGNQMTMDNTDDASGNVQAGTVGVGDATRSTPEGMATRSRTRGDRMTMDNRGRARGNIQAGRIGKITANESASSLEVHGR